MRPTKLRDVAATIRRLRALVALLPLLAVAACAGVDPTANRDQGDASVSVVTLNIYHDRADWPMRLPLIVDGLGALAPDVIALQEVLQHDALPNQAQTIADALGYEMHFVSVDPPDAARRYGNAILTPHPIQARSERRLRPYDDGRTVAHARIAVDGSAIDVYATHLHHRSEGGALRRSQLSDLLAHVAERDDGTPRILLGDFNAVVSSPELQPLLTDYVDVYGSRHADPDAQPANTTLNPAFFDSGRRIDHVFAERGRFEVTDARIVLDRPGNDGHWPSDHFGLFARLRLLPAPDAAGSGPASNSVTLESSSPR